MCSHVAGGRPDPHSELCELSDSTSSGGTDGFLVGQDAYPVKVNVSETEDVTQEGCNHELPNVVPGYSFPSQMKTTPQILLCHSTPKSTLVRPAPQLVYLSFLPSCSLLKDFHL